MIFPECSDEDLRDVFGMAITIGTTAKTKEEALASSLTLVFLSKKTFKKY